MTFVSLSTARFTAGQVDCYIGTRAKAFLPPVIYGHGAGGNGSEVAGGFSLSAVPPIVQALNRVGFVVIGATFTQTWGNATTLARINDGLTFARANLGAHATEPPLLLGISHGAPCVLRWHQANQAGRAMIALPAVDMEAIRTADTLGQRATIDAAYGVTWPAPLPAGVNPAQNTADYLDLPQQIWYSTDDAISANVGAYSTAVGGELHSLGALGHTNAAVAAIDIAAVVAFFREVL